MSRRRLDLEELCLDICNSSVSIALNQVPKDKRAHRLMRKDWVEIRAHLLTARAMLNVAIKRLALGRR